MITILNLQTVDNNVKEIVEIDNSSFTKDFRVIVEYPNKTSRNVLFSVDNESELITVNNICLSKYTSNLLIEFLNQRKK